MSPRASFSSMENAYSLGFILRISKSFDYDDAWSMLSSQILKAAVLLAKALLEMQQESVK